MIKNRRKNRGIWGNVAFRGEAGDEKRLAKAYATGQVVAQERIHPLRLGDRPIQIEVLCVGSTPTIGYVLRGDPETLILNDRVEHGPLFFAL